MMDTDRRDHLRASSRTNWHGSPPGQGLVAELLRSAREAAPISSPSPFAQGPVQLLDSRRGKFRDTELRIQSAFLPLIIHRSGRAIYTYCSEETSRLALLMRNPREGEQFARRFDGRSNYCVRVPRRDRGGRLYRAIFSGPMAQSGTRPMRILRRVLLARLAAVPHELGFVA
jgi:hypothetical protein